MKARFWPCLMFLFLVSGLALAQDTGQITGTVHDPTGASIPTAEVMVRNPDRGIQSVAKTNADGDYLFSALPPGTYNLSVSAPGFRPYHVSGIVVRVAQKIRIDPALQIGVATAEVTVEGTNLGNVDMQSSDVSGIVTGTQISQLQLNGRTFTQLTSLVPGVSNQSGQDEGTVGITGNVAFSFNGGRTEYNNWELNGGDNMDNGSNTSLNVYPSIDAIAEFRVLTSNYGAQYGRNASGTVEVETKSGTRSFHGSAYEFVRNDAFNARNYFEDRVPHYKKNDFGYTVGGPVYIPGKYNTNKDKTFFFWSQEWRRNRVPEQTFLTPVPSMLQRTGDFSDMCPGPDCPVDPATGLPFPGNLVPVDPTGAALLPLIPEPNVPGAALFRASPVTPTNWREELLRIDHNFGPRLRAMFSYIHDTWQTITPTSIWTGSSFPTVQTIFKGPAVSIVGRLTATPSSTLVNEFVFSYTTDHIAFNSTGYPNPTAWKRPANLAMGAFVDNGFGGKLPTIELSDEAYGGGFYEDPNGEWPEGAYNSNPTYTYRDNISKIVGRHNLQFGAYAVTAQKNELSSLMVNGHLVFDKFAAIGTGNAFADLLMGNVYEYSQGSNQVKYHYRYKILEPYFQDDWRVTDRLTLNLGLRVSLFGTYREKYNNAYNWDPAVYNPANTADPFNGLVRCGVNGVSPSCMTGHLFNPAPRVGFALDVFGDGKTALRGGYGIFWEHTNGNEANIEGLMSSGGQSSPLLQSLTQYDVVGYTNLGTGGAEPMGILSFYSMPTKAIWPYVQQWNLGLQHELSRNTVASLSYVGSKGTHLARQRDLNQVPALPDALNPYLPGEPLDCTAPITPSGVAITGQALINFDIACGGDPSPYRPYPGAGNITRLENASSSTYHALQASVRRTVGSLQFNAAYTWSHSMDDASSRYDAGLMDSYNPGLSRASSNFDIRHMLNLSYVYDLPFFKTPGLTQKLLGGWQTSGILSWQTGQPFSPVTAFDNAGVANGLTSGSYPDRIADPTVGIPHTDLTGYGPLVANPDAFAAPRGLTFGDAGRNSVRNPGFTNFNMAVFKRFTVNERAAFEFRAEAFNVFNHTQWGPIAGEGGSWAYNGGSSGTNTFGSEDFLRIGVAHAARILQLGLKFVF